MNDRVTVMPYDFDGVAGMKHSAFYNDDEVIEDIVKWMRANLEAQLNGSE